MSESTLALISVATFIVVVVAYHHLKLNGKLRFFEKKKKKQNA